MEIDRFLPPEFWMDPRLMRDVETPCIRCGETMPVVKTLGHGFNKYGVDMVYICFGCRDCKVRWIKAKR